MPKPTDGPRAFAADAKGRVFLKEGDTAGVRFRFDNDAVEAFETAAGTSVFDVLAHAAMPRWTWIKAAVAAGARDGAGRPVADVPGLVRAHTAAVVWPAAIAALMDAVKDLGLLEAPAGDVAPEGDAEPAAEDEAEKNA